MLSLLNEATRLVRGTHEESRANSYWLGHIRAALSNGPGFMTGNTMEDAIEGLDEFEFECEKCVEIRRIEDFPEDDCICKFCKAQGKTY